MFGWVFLELEKKNVHKKNCKKKFVSFKNVYRKYLQFFDQTYLGSFVMKGTMKMSEVVEKRARENRITRVGIWTGPRDIPALGPDAIG